MTSRYYRLPSLNALATFEAAARHRNLTRAADELNVTPGAVSRQIKALEAELGVHVFVRNQNRLALTDDGETLYATLGRAFSETASTIERIRVDRQDVRVTMACTHAFANNWLMPRMPDFWQRFPDIYVDHFISDDGRDYRRAEIDLRVRYGFGAWPDEACERLFGDALYPVVGPGLAARHTAATADTLAQLPFIHVDWVDPVWIGWEEFLARANVAVKPTKGRRFGNFDAAMEACRNDQGVALGWHRYITAQRRSGALVRLTELALEAPGAHYLTWNVNRAPGEAVRALYDWMIAVAGEETDALCDL